MSRFHLLTLSLVLVWATTLPAAAAPQANAPRSSVAGAPASPVSLPPDALSTLRQRVLVQCGLPNDTSERLPWYFHFEFGRQLLDAGDARRAAAHLLHAVELEPEPGDAKRMYGQWYVDYYPYVELATAQARLGNWPCAADALALAQATGETRKAQYDRAAYEGVRGEVDAHRGESGACRKEDVVAPGYDVDGSDG